MCVCVCGWGRGGGGGEGGGWRAMRQDVSVKAVCSFFCFCFLASCTDPRVI